MKIRPSSHFPPNRDGWEPSQSYEWSKPNQNNAKSLENDVRTKATAHIQCARAVNGFVPEKRKQKQ